MNQPITINILTNKVYPKLERKGLEVGSSLGHDLYVRLGKTVAKASPKTVNGLGPCVGFAIFGTRNKFVAHSAPELENFNAVRDFISKKIDEIRMNDNCKPEDMSAVIYGGIAYDDENSLSDESCRLVDTIEEACNLECVEPTIITGQFSDGLNTRIDSYIGDGQITMWGKLFDKIKLNHAATPAEVENTLEQVFEYIKIPSNARVKVVDKLPYKTEHLLDRQA